MPVRITSCRTGILQAGDTVVVDIGAPCQTAVAVTPRACTAWASRRRRSVRSSRPCEAQSARGGGSTSRVSCESIDAVARDHLATAGLAEFFIHRTGHGIGLETHEALHHRGNSRLLEPGMAFSIEPGVYRAGSHGARIEDIVVCTETGS